MEKLTRFEIDNLISKMMKVNIKLRFNIDSSCASYYVRRIMCNIDECKEILKGNITLDKEFPNYKRISCSTTEKFLIEAGCGKEILMESLQEWFIRIPKQQNGYVSKKYAASLHYESIALKRYSRDFNVKIKEAVNLLNPKIPFLMGKPDGFITSKGHVISLIEIKVPLKLYKNGLAAWKTTQDFRRRLYIDKCGYYRLNKPQKCFYQVQFNLAISNLDHCVVVFYCPYDHDYICVNVYKDIEFLKLNMPRIENIYNEHLLPLLYKNSNK